VISLFVLALPYQWQPDGQQIIVGSEDLAGLTGFYFVEQAQGRDFRWSGPEASVRFEQVPNRPLTLNLTLHAARPADSPPVKVLINGHPVGSLAPGGEFTEYQVAVPRSKVGWTGVVTATLVVDPFVAPPDTRQLGAAVAAISLAPAGLLAIPPWPLLWPLALAVALATLLLAQTGRRWPVIAALVVAMAVAYSATAVLNPEALQGWARWLPAAVVSLGLVLLVGPPLLRRLTEVSRRRPVLFWGTLMTMVFLAIYLPLATTTGYWGDIEIYMAWTHQITHFGVHSAYSPEAVAPPNTTPVLLYLFRPAGEIFRRFFAPDFPPTWIVRDHQHALRFMLRIPALLATLLIAVVIYREMRRDWGIETALLAAAAYLFNPAVIFESAYYGQTGAVHSLFMLASIVLLARGHSGLSWAALTAGALTKPQADIFWPLVVVLTLKRFGWRGALRGVAGAAVTSIVLLLPFIVHNTLGQMWSRVSRPTDYHPMLSATAHNLWWLVSWGNGKATDLGMPPLLDRLGWPIFSYRNIGLGLAGLAYLLVLVRTWYDQRRDVLYSASAYLFLAFFMLATQIHENHMIPMFSLLILAVPADRRLRWIYGALAITATINMALHYPDILRTIVPENPDIWGGQELFWPRWLNSAAQMVIFVYWTVILLRDTLAGLSSRPRRSTHHSQTTNTAPLTKTIAN
jgi:Gpi18-like mannosyltransferase